MTAPATLPVKQLTIWDSNPRKEPGDVDELAASIKAIGIIEPLVVAPQNGSYMVVAGSRRLAAARKAGLKDVPVVVRDDLTERELLEVALIENLQRHDLTPLEEARAYWSLVELGLSQRQLALRIGRSQSHISKRLQLIDLPDTVHRKLDSGGITIDDALELTKLKDHPDRIAKVVRDDRRDVAWAVRRSLEDLKDEQRVAAATAELQSKGARLVAYDKTGYGKTYKRVGTSYDAELQVEVAKHAKEPCHASAVIPIGHHDAGKVVYICTDPKRHAGKGASKLKIKQPPGRGSAVNAKQAREQKALRDAAKLREEFTAELLDRRLPKDELVALIVRALFDEASAETIKNAAQLLGLELDAKDAKDRTPHDYVKVARRYLAAAGPGDLLKVGVAIAVAGANQDLRSSWGSWTRKQWHLDWITSHGYKLDAAERARLEKSRKDAKRWGDDV